MPGALEILRVEGDPPKALNLRIHIPTAKNAHYPNEQQNVSDVSIQLPERYPFPPGPQVFFQTPIWNPNVYNTGRWCYGEWKIMENLELFVTRLMKVVALDPTIINPNSAANPAAAQWYTQMRSQKPNLFPTARVEDFMTAPAQQRLTWRNIT